MTVNLAPAISMVIRKHSLVERGLTLTALQDALSGAPVFSSDTSLLVFGPFFEAESHSKTLTRLGLRFFDDFFDIIHDGGQVPPWCSIRMVGKETSAE